MVVTAQASAEAGSVHPRPLPDRLVLAHAEDRFHFSADCAYGRGAVDAAAVGLVGAIVGRRA